MEARRGIINTNELRNIDQRAIDAAAAALFPNATAATRNREVYTPVSAVLKRAGFDFRIKRPKGWRGRIVRRWLWPEQAWRVIDAADRIDPELGLLRVMLLKRRLSLKKLRTHPHARPHPAIPVPIGPTQRPVAIAVRRWADIDAATIKTVMVMVMVMMVMVMVMVMMVVELSHLYFGRRSALGEPLIIRF